MKKKLKFTIMSLAVLVSVVGAFATRPRFDCTGVPNYYFDGASYKPAGRYGTDYLCIGSSGNCTYVFNGSGYSPCRVGAYTPLGK
jgi:hypothetical protein